MCWKTEKRLPTRKEILEVEFQISRTEDPAELERLAYQAIDMALAWEAKGQK